MSPLLMEHGDLRAKANDFLFIQNLYSALFTNKRALMRYSIVKSITKSYYSESKNIYD